MTEITFNYEDESYKSPTISSNLKHRPKTGLKSKHSTIGVNRSGKLLEMSPDHDEKVKMLEDENSMLNEKNKALKIDKKILMNMIKDMIEKAPESGSVIDRDLFLNTLKDY